MIVQGKIVMACWGESQEETEERFRHTCCDKCWVLLEFCECWKEFKNMSNIYDKINNGDYKTKTPYPTKPVMPTLLTKKANELNSKEINGLKKLQNNYKQDHARYLEDKQFYYAEGGVYMSSLLWM